MDANTAKKFILEYADRCERVSYAEKQVRDQEAFVKSMEKQLAERREALRKEQESLDMAHAFALSAIKALTPARGFTV